MPAEYPATLDGSRANGNPRHNPLRSRRAPPPPAVGANPETPLARRARRGRTHPDCPLTTAPGPRAPLDADWRRDSARDRALTGASGGARLLRRVTRHDTKCHGGCWHFLTTHACVSRCGTPAPTWRTPRVIPHMGSRIPPRLPACLNREILPYAGMRGTRGTIPAKSSMSHASLVRR
jgi:hypothetical protein